MRNNETANQVKEKRNIPSSAFDVEYRTQWRDEVDFLASRGIYYTIRKKEGEYQIPVYKYSKTVDLFIALSDFYLQRKRNYRSTATYTGKPKKPEQQTFLNDDMSIKEEFVANKEEPKVVEPVIPSSEQDDTE